MKIFKLKVDSTKVSGTHSDFPAYVNLNRMPNSFWNEVTNGGGDIRVYSDSGLTTELPREVVSCDNVELTGELWVKTSMSSTTTIFITVDGTSTEPASDATYGSENVWNSSYQFVSHLEDLTTSTVKDSTSNGRNGTKPAANQPIETNGKLEKAQDFNGSNDRISIPDVNYGTVTNFTLKAWIKMPANSAAMQIINRDDLAETRSFQFRVEATGKVGFIRFKGGGGTESFTSVGVVDDSDWHFVVATFDDSIGSKIYIDGVEDGSNAVLTDSVEGTGTPFIGTRLDRGSYEGFFDGIIDEVRIKSSSEDSDWISTEYNNQSSNVEFWEIEERVATLKKYNGTSWEDTELNVFINEI